MCKHSYEEISIKFMYKVTIRHKEDELLRCTYIKYKIKYKNSPSLAHSPKQMENLVA